MDGTPMQAMESRSTPVGNPTQYAAAVVSVVVLLTFAGAMWAALTRVLPPGSEPVLNTLLGTLAAMATTVVGYWVGSSAGSAQKNELLYRSAPVTTQTQGDKA